MIFAREQGLALKHFGKDTTCAPYIDLDVVFLPGKHDFWGTVVSRRDIACHLRVLNAGKTEVADLQITIFVHQDIARLQIAVDHSCRMYVFESSLQPISFQVDRAMPCQSGHTKI